MDDDTYPEPSAARQGRPAARSGAPAGRESEDSASADALANHKTPTTLPAFTPVPRAKDRSNGWKPHVQQAFIEALADTGSVASAARAVNRSTHGAYHLRRQPGAEEFAAAWEAALDFGMKRVEDVAMDRALNGVEVPVYSYGQLVGTRISYNDRLLMFMLRNRAPGRFAEGKAKGMNAVDQMELNRLRKKWRKEWEREWGAEQLRQEVATMESINAKIDLIRAKEEGLESPRVRAAREALEAAIAADREEGYSPIRDPEHAMYRPSRTEDGPENDYGIVWEDDEPEDEAGEGEGEEENPRWRGLKDEGWD